MANTANLALFGFVFWLLAAHKYSASSVGTFTSVTAGTGLLAAIAALGLQNTMIRHIAGSENPRELVAIAVAAIATVGAALCLLTIFVIGPHIPASLHLRQHGGTVALLTALVVFTAVSGILDAALIAIRATYAVLVTNLIASVVKIIGLLLLTRLHAEGLLVSFGLALFISTVLAGAALIRRTWGKLAGFASFLLLRRYLLLTSGNYVATILGILPTTIVPIEALILRGPADTARFAVAGLLAGFLMVIPSTVAQVLFAEASRKGVSLEQKFAGPQSALRYLCAPPPRGGNYHSRRPATAAPLRHVLRRGRDRRPASLCLVRPDGRRDISCGLATHSPRPGRRVRLHERRQCVPYSYLRRTLPAAWPYGGGRR